ncbi:glycoside hydrolase domain-containing protein [Mucilaginibacter humi]|uniref:glycoside hydrolase domain-containing protein n=1 Tax=Mucilaginibacter humi TaxID=2732510 RepID=UPI00293BFB1E|nr:glycoside hydrolase domain-containing protein [Mucilaginibacter humi]
MPYPNYRESTAKTLEYAYDDWCGYQLAKMTGNKYYMDVFARQMYNYKNVYNPATRFMQGKGADGQWTKDFDPIEWGGPFTEGNSWHYTRSVFRIHRV